MQYGLEAVAFDESAEGALRPNGPEPIGRR